MVMALNFSPSLSASLSKIEPMVSIVQKGALLLEASRNKLDMYVAIYGHIKAKTLSIPVSYQLLHACKSAHKLMPHDLRNEI